MKSKPVVAVAVVVDAAAVEVVVAEHAPEAGFRLPPRLRDQLRLPDQLRLLGQLRLRLPQPDPRAVSRVRKSPRAVHQVERGPAALGQLKVPSRVSDQRAARRARMSQARVQLLANLIVFWTSPVRGLVPRW